MVQSPRAESFGNCAEELFFGLLKARREQKKALFLHPQNLFSKRLTANRKLFHFRSTYSMQSKFVCYWGGWALTTFFVLMSFLRRLTKFNILYRILKSVRPNNPARAIFDFYHMSPTLGRSTLWQPENVVDFSWETVASQDWARQFEEYAAPKLRPSDLRRAELIRTRMGVPLEDWFVCLHARESGYLSDADDFRNSSIQNYLKAIQSITKQGGWVIRIGDQTMVRLPTMERVIDYPHTNHKSELMDVYLISDCSFFIGTTSGPSDVATLFKKRMVLVNAPEWSLGFPLKFGDLMIPKHIYSNAQGRYLSTRESLDEPSTSQGFNSLSNDYLMYENTSEEIKDVVEEMLNQQECFGYSNLQREFNVRRQSQIRRWFETESNTPVSWKFRVASRVDAAFGTFGRKYLEANWIADSLLNSSKNEPQNIASDKI